jgi:ferredoxin
VKIWADTERCCGSGMCVLTAPKVFDQDDTGTVVLLDATPPTEQHTAVKEAAHLCPSGALSLEPENIGNA